MSKQTRLVSFLEACINTFVGYVISLMLWLFAVQPLFGIEASFGQSLLINLLFTVVSIARSYAVRRFFANEFHHRAVEWAKKLMKLKEKYLAKD